MRSNWQNDKIVISCDILDNMRIPLNAEQREDMPGNVPYYGANGVQGYISGFLFEEDLILMAEDGGNFEQYSTRPIAYKISGKSWVNNHAHILRAKSGYNQEFIFYSLVHKNILPFIKGGTRSKLNLSDLKEIEINFPPLPQQRKIAKILSTCDEVIEKTEAAIAKYQAIKQGMMHDLFTRGIDIKTGKLRPKQEDAPELYQESKLGWIPKEWEVNSIDEIVVLRHGYQFRDYDFVNEGIDVVKIGQVGRNGLLNLTNSSKISADRLEEFKGIRLFNGDILMALTGATLGKTAIIKNIEKPMVQNYRVGYFNPKDELKLDKTFLYYLLIGESVQNEILGFVNAGAQGNIGKADFEKIDISIPISRKEQELISHRLLSLDERIQIEKAAFDKYKQVKFGLMQDLLSGNKVVTV